MLLLLDFAETLAFRPKKEIETDVDFISQSAGISSSDIIKKYKKFCEDNDWLEQFPKYHSSIEEEIADYDRHFKQFRDYSKIKFDTGIVAHKKVYENQHQLFAGVKSFLKKANCVFDSTIIISEGRPSRKINILNLGISEYIDKIIVTDIEGVEKSKIIEEIDTYLGSELKNKQMILVDDQSTYESSCGERINFVLIDRKGAAILNRNIKRIGELDETFEYCDLPA